MITIPTIATIRDQIIADIEGKIGQTVPTLPKAFFRVLAMALAGVLALMYRFGAWVYDQIFVSTAAAEALARRGAEYGLTRNPAQAAVLTATVTGASDTVTQAGWLWQSGGIVYEQQADVAIVAGTATITVECLTAGDVGNLANGATISLVTPQAGVDNDATIASTITTGEDEEGLEVFRARIAFRQKNPPQGGAIPDYINWALEVPGIVKAFAYNTAPGVVTVYPLIALSGTRIPDGAKIAEVDAYLEDEYRKPLCATVVTAAMTERTITPTVTSVTPDNATLRAAIEAAWTAHLLGRFPKQYADEALPTNVISLSGLLAEAMGAGAQGIVATMEIDGVPGTIDQYTLLDSEIVKLGTVVWPV